MPISQGQDFTGINVPLNLTMLQNKENVREQAVISTQKNSNIVTAEGDKEVGVQADHAVKDLDEESTAQNCLNVAKQGDLSPRHIEKVKSAVKGRKKQVKEIFSSTTGGVQTRRTLNKSHNQ